jgi:hypothetical protein
MPGPNLAQEIRDALVGPIAANNTLEVATRNGLINLKGNRPLTDRQDFDEQNVWQPTVLFARVRRGTSDTVDVAAKMVEIQ